MNTGSHHSPDDGKQAPTPRRRESLLEMLFMNPAADSDARPATRVPTKSVIGDIFLEEDPAEASQQLPCAVEFDETKFFWAMRNLPVEEAVKHCVICGCIGSGKTTAIDLLLQSIAPRFRSNWHRPEQLVVFDGKGDLVPKLAAWGLSAQDHNVWLFNPFDERTCVWNLAEAVSQPAMARHLASLLVPEEHRSTAPYFAQAGQQIVFSVLLALNRIAPGQWSLRDLLLALETKERIEALTEKHARARAIAGGILNDERHSMAVMSTLATKLARFEEVAALWHTAPVPRRFVISEFLRKPGVLILGHDPVFKDSLWPINAMLLKALTQEILRGTETRQPRHWFVLDEFRAMENVDCMRELLNLGRSKGAAVTLGTQSIDGLMEIYGEGGTNTLLEQCTYKSFLRAGGPKTAEWAERFINKARRIEQTVTETNGPAGASTAVQHSLHDRSILTAGFFLNLDLPGPGGYFAGVHDLPCMSCFRFNRLPFERVIAWRKPALKIPALQRRTKVQDQHLQSWDDAEEARLFGDFGVSEATPVSPTASRPSAADTASESPPAKTKLPKPPPDDEDPSLYPVESDDGG